MVYIKVYKTFHSIINIYEKEKKFMTLHAAIYVVSVRLPSKSLTYFRPFYIRTDRYNNTKTWFPQPKQNALILLHL